MPSIGSLCVGSFFIHSFFYLVTTLLKSDIFWHSKAYTKKTTPPTVFNPQISDWVHCEEETGVYYQLSWFTYKLVIFLFILQKNTLLFKKFPKIYRYFFFQKEIIYDFLCIKSVLFLQGQGLEEFSEWIRIEWVNNEWIS